MYPTLHEHIFDKTKENVVWKKLENLFSRKALRNKTTLIRRLVNLKYKDGNNMVEHIISFQGIMNKLVVMKMNIDEEMQASLLLSSLLDSWKTLMVTVSNSTPNGIPSSVKDSLLSEEARRKKKVNVFLEYLFMKNKKTQKDVEEVKVEILMVLEEDPNP